MRTRARRTQACTLERERTHTYTQSRTRMHARAHTKEEYVWVPGTFVLLDWGTCARTHAGARARTHTHTRTHALTR